MITEPGGEREQTELVAPLSLTTTTLSMAYSEIGFAHRRIG
jgi:hypothetical protein